MTSFASSMSALRMAPVMLCGASCLGNPTVC